MTAGILSSGTRFLDLSALGDCALWLDAADAASITHSSGSVSQVNDKSGNARHFTQGVSAQQPRIDTHTQNGLAVLDFDGSNDLLTLGSSGLLRNVSGATTYCVARPESGGSPLSLVSISNNTNVARSMLDVGRTVNKIGIGGRRLDGDTFASIQGSSSYPADFAAYTGILDYANSDAFVYHGQVLEGSTTSFISNGNTSDTNSGVSRIGAAPNGVFGFFNGQIAEVAVFSVAHNADQRSVIWAYLSRKWGLS